MKFINNTAEKLLVKISADEFRWIKQKEIIEIENLKKGNVNLEGAAVKKGMTPYSIVKEIVKTTKRVIKPAVKN